MFTDTQTCATELQRVICHQTPSIWRHLKEERRDSDKMNAYPGEAVIQNKLSKPEVMEM